MTAQQIKFKYAIGDVVYFMEGAGFNAKVSKTTITDVQFLDVFDEILATYIVKAAPERPIQECHLYLELGDLFLNLQGSVIDKT